MNISTPSKLERDCIVVIGKENTGKSQLIASLTGQAAHSANFRGSTVTCDTYQSETYTFIDTPGIHDTGGYTDADLMERNVLAYDTIHYNFRYPNIF